MRSPARPPNCWGAEPTGAGPQAIAELADPEFGSERDVHVPAELTELLSEHMRRAGTGPGDSLVSSDARPLNRNSAGHRWRQLGQAAGLHLWPTAEDRTRAAAGGLLAAALGARADWVRTSGSR